jgi:hypothetical protein
MFSVDVFKMNEQGTGIGAVEAILPPPSEP